MEPRMTLEQYRALLDLEAHPEERTDEEVGRLIARAYPQSTPYLFVRTFYLAADTDDRFDSDTGHIDGPIACITALLAYLQAGGRLLSEPSAGQNGSARSTP